MYILIYFLQRKTFCQKIVFKQEKLDKLIYEFVLS